MRCCDRLGCREIAIVLTSVLLEDLSNFTKQNSRCSPLLYFIFVQLGVVVSKVRVYGFETRKTFRVHSVFGELWYRLGTLTCLLHGAESFLRNYPVLSYSRNSPYFMEPKGSLPHLQQLATFPNLEPNQSSPCPSSHFRKIHFNLIFLHKPGSSKWSLSHRAPNQNPVGISPLPTHATCPAYLKLLDLITRKILGEEYRSLSY